MGEVDKVIGMILVKHFLCVCDDGGVRERVQGNLRTYVFGRLIAFAEPSPHGDERSTLQPPTYECTSLKSVSLLGRVRFAPVDTGNRLPLEWKESRVVRVSQIVRSSRYLDH